MSHFFLLYSMMFFFLFTLRSLLNILVAHRFVLPLNWTTHNTRAPCFCSTVQSIVYILCLAQIFRLSKSVLHAIHAHTHTTSKLYFDDDMSNIVVKCFHSMLLLFSFVRAQRCTVKPSVTVVSPFTIVSSTDHFFHFHSLGDNLFAAFKITDTKYTYYYCCLFWKLTREKNSNLNLSIGNENSHFFHISFNLQQITQSLGMARPKHRNWFFLFLLSFEHFCLAISCCCRFFSAIICSVSMFLNHRMESSFRWRRRQWRRRQQRHEDFRFRYGDSQEKKDTVKYKTMK